MMKWQENFTKAYGTKIISRFQIPEAAAEHMNVYLTKEEQHMIACFEPECFTGEELAAWLAAEGAGVEAFRGAEGQAGAAVEELVQEAFVRGVLVKDGPQYSFGSFYGRLDIFVTKEQAAYRRLPEEVRRSWDSWYLEKYLERLGGGTQTCPTDDRVLTLSETLSMIDGREDEPFLAYCDCRSLLGDCGMPAETCITYRTAENSFAAKGLARRITKEEAKQVVRSADKAGLIHTANAGGICNCCTDCCYLFRASEKLKLQASWPIKTKRIQVCEEKCIGCGRCLKRCPFQVFSLDEGRKAKAERLADCVGCGLCAGACPAGALSLTERRENGNGTINQL